MPPHKSQDYKLSAVKYYLKSKDASETCRIFECSSRSLVRWVKKYQTSQSIERKGRVNVAYKINKQHINQILSENVKSIIKEIPKQTYHKLFIGSYIL